MSEPMSTAPKDGTRVIASWVDRPGVRRVWWDRLERAWVDGTETPFGDPITYEPDAWVIPANEPPT
jgi:hypothetical protein